MTQDSGYDALASRASAHARSGRPPAASDRPPLTTAPPGRSRSVRAMDRRARRSSTARAVRGDGIDACSRAEASVIVSRLTPMTGTHHRTSLTAHPSRLGSERPAQGDGCVGGRSPKRHSSCTSRGRSSRSRLASSTHSGIHAGESVTTIDRSPGGCSSACSIASMPPTTARARDSRRPSRDGPRARATRAGTARPSRAPPARRAGAASARCPPGRSARPAARRAPAPPAAAGSRGSPPTRRGRAPREPLPGLAAHLVPRRHAVPGQLRRRA